MQPTPPPLPRGLADPRPVVAIGTLGWSIAAVGCQATGTPPGWVWTCVVAALLGLLGLIMIHLQYSAAQRGSRTAQRGLS